MASLHPCDAEGDGIERPHDRFAGDREREGEDPAGVARVDDAVVPQVRGAVERRRFAVELVDDALAHLVDLRRVGGSLPSRWNFCSVTVFITPAACSPPITAVRLLGQAKMKRGS